MRGTTIRCKFRAPRQASTVAHAPKPGRAARMLALAHHIDSLVDAGDLSSNAAAAQALGLTRARLTQVMNLLLLSPELQERLLTGDIILAERALRHVVSEPTWSGQEIVVEELNDGRWS